MGTSTGGGWAPTLLCLLCFWTIVCQNANANSMHTKQKHQHLNSGGAAVRKSLTSMATGGGNNCTDLSGVWTNQLGSRLTLRLTADRRHLVGTYQTVVEQATGFASQSVAQLKGALNGRLVTWSVTWSGNRSVTAWSGQCFCDCTAASTTPHDTMHTMWMMTTAADSCQHSWAQTRIGQDVFVRVKDPSAMVSYSVMPAEPGSQNQHNPNQRS